MDPYNKKIKNKKIKIDEDETEKREVIPHLRLLTLTMSIVTATSFNPKKITISPLKTLQSGAKQAYLNYDRERLVMQSAVSMKVPFGLNIADQFGPVQYSLNLSFAGADQNPDIKQFMEAIQRLDDAMIEEGVKNSKAWFKSDMSKEVISAFYNPSLKISKDKDGKDAGYPPNMKIKLRQVDGQFTAKFYDVNRKPYDLNEHPVQDLLAKGVQVTVIMECTGVWFATPKYGLTWVAKQILIHDLPKKVSDFAFVGLSSVAASVAAAALEDEKESNEMEDDAVFQKPSVLAAVMPPKAASAAASAAASDSVDDAQGDDIEPIPAPKPKIVKKIIKK
jgi:hypothetical protein